MKLREGMYVREKPEDWGQKLTHCRTYKIVISSRDSRGIGMHSYDAIQLGIADRVCLSVTDLCGSVLVNGYYVEEIDQFEGMLLEVGGAART